MKRFLPLILLLILCSWNSAAQVTEVNFLGKIWNLHGVDYRMRIMDHSYGYYTNHHLNAAYDPKESKEYHTTGLKYLNEDYGSITAFFNHSVGLVFRPFNSSDLDIVRQMEFVHSFGFEYKSRSISAYKPIIEDQVRTRLDCYHLSYSPQYMFSSPSFWDGSKFYLILSATFNFPLRSYVYANPPDSISRATGNVQYEKSPRIFTDRYVVNYFEIGAGGGLGLRHYINCNWNFHIELLLNRFATFYNSTSKTFLSNYYGLNVGLRYKFGIPTEEEKKEKESENPRIFW